MWIVCNYVAVDAISKLTDYDDWHTTIEVFRKISETGEKFTIDRFANNENTKT